MILHSGEFMSKANFTYCFFDLMKTQVTKSSELKSLFANVATLSAVLAAMIIFCIFLDQLGQ
jgi:hypothetical protein